MLARDFSSGTSYSRSLAGYLISAGTRPGPESSERRFRTNWRRTEADRPQFSLPAGAGRLNLFAQSADHSFVNRNLRRIFSFVILVAASAATLFAQDFSGKVVGITDRKHDSRSARRRGGTDPPLGHRLPRIEAAIRNPRQAVHRGSGVWRDGDGARARR